MNNVAYALAMSGLLLIDCSGRKSDKTNALFEQYFVEGKHLYALHCSRCHQPDGKGLASLYPPLAGADFIGRYPHRVICAIKYGLSDSIVVNEKHYQLSMPGVTTLTPLEIAEIVTYISNDWGNDHGFTSAKAAHQTLQHCAVEK